MTRSKQSLRNQCLRKSILKELIHKYVYKPEYK